MGGIASSISKPEEDCWSKIIPDPSEDARSSVIQSTTRYARTKLAMKLVQDRLEDEAAVDVRAELHRAMTTLLQRGADGGN